MTLDLPLTGRIDLALGAAPGRLPPFGIALQTACTDWLDIYASYQQASLEQSGMADSEDLDVFTIGTKVSF